MGAALGFALAQPWPAALAVVLALGLGMALPFLLLALSPGLAERLPRPGAWMETLKQLLAFPMFATAAWLIWVLSVQVGPIGVGAGLAGVVLLALGLWLLEASRGGQGRWQRLALVSAGFVLAAALWLGVDLAPGSPASATASGDSLDLSQAGRSAQSAPSPPLREVDSSRAVEGAGVRLSRAPSDSEAGMPAPVARVGHSGPPAVAYSPSRLEGARAAGRPVFVNMTAAWCITCLVNERVALSRPAVVAAFAERDLLYLKGDWTNRDAQISSYLASFGRSGVPLYVYYAPGAEPRILPQVLTESIVLEAL
jgi:thiol:disulfide interchange protein DsbD